MWCVYTRRSTPGDPFSFADLIQLQAQILDELKTLPAHRQKAMVFAEVAPTVTLGARQVHDESQKAHFAQFEAHLKTHGVQLHAGERGGNETWHGPGQWVGFILTPLEAFTGDPRGVRKAVYEILENVRSAILSFEPQAKIEDEARLGIWSPRGKLVSIGIKIREGFISSGFALNCFPHETSFFGINPCGLTDAQPDFLFLSRVDSGLFEHEFRRMPARLISFF